jgi:predicted transcriptional regulator
MKSKRKIIDDELLKLIDSGVDRKEIAKRFGCSQPAITKRLAKLRPEPTEPLKIDALTPKERAFVVAIASGETQTNAAIKAYDVSSRSSAKALGCALMNNHAGIREAIQEICDRKIPVEGLVTRLSQHVDSADPAASLRAIDMGLKLHSAYPPEKRVNLNADTNLGFIDLSAYGNIVKDES